MTEDDWDACTDARELLRHLGEGASRRKLRLFACACCGRIEHLLRDREGSRRALEMSERYADGLVSREEMVEAEGWACREAEESDALRATGRAAWAVRAATWVGFAGFLEGARHVEWHAAWDAVTLANAARYEEGYGLRAALREDEGGYYLLRLRDIFGPLPFRAVTSDPAWLRWSGGTVQRLAVSAYEERDFSPERLGVLADALEDAGCADPDVLTHCRTGGVHVKGCWVVDLLLGKE
jgi:hypothetical protein